MIIEDQKIYSGEFIHNRFAYRYFGDDVSPTGNIVAFIAPAAVKENGMIDLEDLLHNDFIYSDKMIHFCWEIPCINDGFGAVSFQRLFNTGIAGILHDKTGKNIVMEGDDIIFMDEHNGGGIIQQRGKASVSITHMIKNVAIGHTGININAGENAPAFAYSTNLGNEDVYEFISAVISYFNLLVGDIFIATSKVI